MGTTGGPVSGTSSRPSSSRSSSLQPPNGDFFSHGRDGAGLQSDSPDGYLVPSAIYPSRAWRSLDPRTSSTQSLAPSLALREQRRTLLVIYIHGFMGNDSSFRSFPAHIHQYLKEALAETHVIHTKIYPRYKTYKSIQVARDNFSLWLEPHESPTTDVVLVGHSMGGLLAAEVALQPRQHGAHGSSPFRHRILGTISLDAPLLGLHPGIVVSGIASLFRPAPSPAYADASNYATPGSQQSLPLLSPDPSIYSEIAPPSGASSPAPLQPTSSSSSYQFQAPPHAPDPYFNPTFFNDTSFVDRGWFRNIAHFASKHKQENLVEAAAHHVMSHLEFGGCLADYPGMIARYNKLRALEDVDDITLRANGERAVRVRFVNYYTVSTGPLKRDKEKKALQETTALLKPPPPLSQTGQLTPERGSLDLPLSPPTPAFTSGTGTPRISIEDHSDSGRPTALQLIEPIPEPDELVLDNPTPTTQDHDTTSRPTSSSSGAKDNKNPDTPVPGEDDPAEPELPQTQPPELPTIPEIPPPPEAPFDPSIYTSKEERKQAEKEFKLSQKNHDQAVKKHAKVLKERDKILEKHRQKLEKDAKKAEKQRLAEEKEAEKRRVAEENKDKGKGKGKITKERMNSVGDLEREPQGTEESERLKEEEEKKNKDKVKLRKFCMLPSKVPGVVGCSGSGKEKEDPTWVKVYMEGVDEVGAHCGLFFPGPHYEKLVGDVGSRIVNWVGEDCTRRVILEEG
ncbi:hypothetical protein V8F20_004708 [Naviculisporaceae sp. PSN 640]